MERQIETQPNTVGLVAILSLLLADEAVITVYYRPGNF